MKTKTKKTYMTVGRLFDKMAEKSTFFDYRVLGPGEMENPLFNGFFQIDANVHFYDDSVCLHDIGTWPRRQRVKVKGRTATFDHQGDGYTIQVRFYTIKPVQRLS